MEGLDFYNLYIGGCMQILTGFHFFTKCLQKKEKIWLYVLFALIGLTVLQITPDGIFEFVVYILLLVAAGIFLYGVNGLTAVLYAVTTVEIMQLNYGISNFVLVMVSSFVLTSDLKMTFAIIVFFDLLALCGSALCYYAVYRHFAPHGAKKSRYSLMILTPVLMVFLLEGYINRSFYGNTVDLGGSFQKAGPVHYQVFAIQILGIASLFCILYAYGRLEESFRLNTQLSLLEQESRSLRQYVDEAKTRYEKTKSFRHDLKNHIMMVRELLQNEKPAEALQYLNDLESVTQDLSFPCSTNHPTLDILLGNKLGIAGNEGVDVSCSLHLPYPCSVADIDFCIILSNALDNAIHACRRMEGGHRYIHISGSLQGDFLLLTVENSFEGNDSYSQGTGLANIKSTVEKYHGAMNIRMEGSVFCLSILLILS